MNWEPSRADHSIERATLTVSFGSRFNDDSLDELVVALRKSANQEGFTARHDQPDPIEFTVGEGVPVHLNMAMSPRRVEFQRLSPEHQLVDAVSIGGQNLMLTTFRYQRWGQFFELLCKFHSDLAKVQPLDTLISKVRLEYIDRFQSAVPEADYFEVIDQDSPFMTRNSRSKAKAFHVHSGWFDFEAPNVRFLTNINVDTLEQIVPGSNDIQKTISILTLRQSESLNGNLDNAVKHMERLHDDLKVMYSNIITKEAAARVALPGQ